MVASPGQVLSGCADAGRTESDHFTPHMRGLG